MVDDKQFQQYWSDATDEQQLKEILIHDERYLSVSLDDSSRLVGMKIKNVELPDKCLIAIIKRENEIVVPDGDTEFQKGDKVTVIGEPVSILEFQKLYIFRQ